MSLSPVMNLGLVGSLGLELCSIALLAFCGNNSPFQKQISVIKTFLSWNGFPRSVTSNLIKHFTCSGSEPSSSNNDTSKTNYLASTALCRLHWRVNGKQTSAEIKALSWVINLFIRIKYMLRKFSPKPMYICKLLPHVSHYAFLAS